MKNTELSKELLSDLVCIAIFGGGDMETADIIGKELDSARITYYMEGSVVYNVLVHKKDAKSALELLRRNEPLKGKWHQLVNPD